MIGGDISRFVTDTTGDVYAIVGLPEEILAVVFAYVSRSPKSFRENLLEVSAERAEAFHEKWVLQYGHASVAEHAAIHLGIERISRLASAILEDARLISVTEYSQRYQEPSAGNVHMPRELRDTAAERTARQCFGSLYSVYGETLDGLSAYLAREMPRRQDESELAWAKRLRRRAFEDARYTLPLATTTNLGLTTNARELELVISKCLTHPLAEMRDLGEGIREAARRVAPTLVKYAATLPYRRAVEARRRQELADIERVSAEDALGRTDSRGVGSDGGAVQLLDWTGRETVSGHDRAPGGDDRAERAALLAVVGAFLEAGARDAARMRAHLAGETTAALGARYARLLGEPAAHESLPRELECVTYTFDVVLSEAAWHQLLRHRMMSAFPGEPRLDLGLRVPPLIRMAGLESHITAAHDLATRAREEIVASFPDAAPYFVTNAHLRRVRLVMNLRQLFHLTRLRTSPKAQWDIRDIAARMLEAVSAVHPSLVARAAPAAPPAS